MNISPLSSIGEVLGPGLRSLAFGWLESIDMDAAGELFAVWGFPLAAGGVALYGLGVAVWGGMAVTKAKNWLTTEGRVVESRKSIARMHNHEVGSYRPRVHCAHVSYEYSVNGQKYRSSRIKVGGDVDTSDPKRADAVLERFGVGDSVVVYYDPMRPEKAALEIDSSAMFFGICMALGGAVFAVGSAVKNGLL